MQLFRPAFRSAFTLPCLSLVLALVLGVALPATAAPKLGVMPTASAKRVRGKAAKQLGRLDKKLATELSGFDVQNLRKNKKEKFMRIKAKKLTKAALKRGKKKKVDFVLTNFASGKGKRLALRFNLIDVKSGKSVWQKKVKPNSKDKKTWAKTVKDGVSPFLSEAPAEPAAEPAPAAPAEPAAAEPAPTAAAEPAAEPAAADADPAPTKTASAEEPAPAEKAPPVSSPAAAKAEADDEGGSLAWLWYSSGGAVGVLGLGALAGAGVMGVLALNDSNAFVASAAQNADLRQSSEEKALITDVLWVTGGVLTVAAVGLVSVGVVSSLSE